VTGSDENRWPDEPDDPSDAVEPDEQELVADLGPDVPDVEIPEAPDPSANDVPEDLAKAFWRLVVIFNISLLALGVGPMLIFFEGNWEDGLGLLAIGVLTFGYGYYRYKRVTSDDLTEDGEDDRHTDEGRDDENSGTDDADASQPGDDGNRTGDHNG